MDTSKIAWSDGEEGENIWRDSVNNGRSRDPMLSESLNQLSDFEQKVKPKSTSAEFVPPLRPAQYSPAWWKSWKKETNKLHQKENSTDGSRSARLDSFLRQLFIALFSFN
jgi:hypothetical protein